MTKTMKMALLLIPAALVLGFVASRWLHVKQAPPVAQANALLAVGAQIDGSLTGLRDAQNQPVDEAAFAGRYRIVSFGFTSCPDICPTMLAGVKHALEQLGPDAGNIVPLFISVDPERDTPELVGKYTASFDPRIVGLTGAPEVLATVAKGYKVQYAKRPVEGGAQNAAYTVDHTALVFLIDPQQRIRALIPTSEGPQRIAQEIVAAYRSLQSVTVTQSWARATPPGAQVGAAYVQIQNSAEQEDRLLGLESPRAGLVEVHETSMKDGMMSMQQIAELELPSKGTVELSPGGTHIMLMQLRQPLVAGETFPLTLRFRRAPPVTVSVTVASAGATSAPMPAKN